MSFPSRVFFFLVFIGIVPGSYRNLYIQHHLLGKNTYNLQKRVAVCVYTIPVDFSTSIACLTPLIEREKMIEIEDVIIGAFAFAGVATLMLYVITNPGGAIPINLQDVAVGSFAVFALSKVSFLSSL